MGAEVLAWSWTSRGTPLADWAFRGIRRHRGQAPGRVVPPVQLLGRQPDEIDDAIKIKLDVVHLALDSSVARATDMIGIDDGDPEVPEPGMQKARNGAAGDVTRARRRHARKLFRDGVRRPAAGLQGEDLRAFFLRPQTEVHRGAARGCHSS